MSATQFVRRKQRWLVAAALTAILVSTVACENTTAPAGGTAFAGIWIYDGRQSSPQYGQVTGSLHWAGLQNSAGAFEGTVSLVERAGSDEGRVIQGVLAGEMSSDSLADFTIILQSGSRRHVGQWRGDSIAGFWVATQGQDLASGTFVLRREGPSQ